MIEITGICSNVTSNKYSIKCKKYAYIIWFEAKL